MKKKLQLLTTLGIAVFIIFSCGGDEASNKYTDAANCSAITSATNNYSTTIKPILDNNCAFGGCHDAVTASEGIVLSDYANAKKVFADGKALCSINHDGCEPMPQDADKLDAFTLNLLACWVKQGTPQ